MIKNKKLQGIGGWLYVVGLGLILAPIVLGLEIYNLMYPLMAEGTILALFDGDGYYYNPTLGYYIIWVALLMFAFLALSVWALLLFSRADYRFPNLYLLIWLFGALAWPITTWSGARFLPEHSPTEDIYAYLGFLVGAAIWCAYILLSERVKNTFTEGRPKNDA